MEDAAQLLLEVEEQVVLFVMQQPLLSRPERRSASLLVRVELLGVPEQPEDSLRFFVVVPLLLRQQEAEEEPRLALEEIQVQAPRLLVCSAVAMAEQVLQLRARPHREEEEVLEDTAVTEALESGGAQEMLVREEAEVPVTEVVPVQPLTEEAV